MTTLYTSWIDLATSIVGEAYQAAAAGHEPEHEITVKLFERDVLDADDNTVHEVSLSTFYIDEDLTAPAEINVITFARSLMNQTIENEKHIKMYKTETGFNNAIIKELKQNQHYYLITK